MSVGCWVAEFSSKLPMFEVGSFLRKDSSLHTEVQKEKNGLWHERGGDLKDFYKGFSLEWYNIAFNVEGNLPESTGKLGNQVPVA